MRKLFKIIIAILIIILILLLGAWQISRKRATQNGSQAPTFRQFIGLGTKEVPPSTVPDTGLTPDETPTETPSSPTETPGGSSVAVSQFTDEPLTPTQSTPIGTVSPANPSSGGNQGSSGFNTNPINPPSEPSQTTGPSGCTDADLNISFTPDEINRLRELQNRFYAVAGSLQSDAAVAAELENYTTFKAKGDTLAELYAYCSTKAPLISNPAYTTRIATPFWRDAAKDREGYMPINLPQLSGPFANIFTNLNNIDPRNVRPTQVIIQRIFKLNLW